MLLMQKSAGGLLLPKSAVKFERYLMGEVREVSALFYQNTHNRTEFHFIGCLMSWILLVGDICWCRSQ